MTNLFAAILGASVVAAAPEVRYHVTTSAETVSVTRPHQTQIGDPEITGKPPVLPRRSPKSEMRSSADVTIAGDVIRVENYVVDMGRGGKDPVSALSEDRGGMFVVTENGKAQKWPFAFSLEPYVLAVRAFATMAGGAEPDDIRVVAGHANDGGLVIGHRTTRREVRARFTVAPDPRFRREAMHFDVRMEVWTLERPDVSAPAGLQAWTVGLRAVDEAIRAQLARSGGPGLPVRSRTTVEMRSGRTTQTTVSRMEVSDLKVTAEAPVVTP